MLSERRVVAGWLVVAFLVIGWPPSAVADQVTVDYFGTLDFRRFESFQFGASDPARSYDMEQLIRDQLAGQLTRRGYRQVESDGQLVVTHSVLVTPPLGLLRVEIRVDGELAFLATASGLDQGKLSKNEKMVRRLIKRMFKSFPARSN